MPAIDRLLAALADHEVDHVLLEPGRPPRLVRGELEIPLARGELTAETLRRLVAEVAGPGAATGATAVTAASAAPSSADPTPWRLEHRCAGRRWLLEGEGEAGRGPVRVVPAARAHPSIADLASLLRRLAELGGSDLHLAANRPPRVRVDGELIELPYAPPTAERLEELLLAETPDRYRDRFLATGDADFGLEIAGDGRYRANLLREREGASAVFRRIPLAVPTAEELGLPDAITELAALGRGLVLVTGPTGSGKSTTLAALIDLVNRTRKEHVLTIEDPIEFVHVSKGCLVRQREVGSHTASFAAALRAALREDPDVVLVGEMRDLETTSIAVETAETGHLVFGTLHTTSAAATVERMIDQYPAGQQAQIRVMLASTLRAVVAQLLLPRIGGGRAAAFEVLRVTPAVSNLIREGKVFQIPSVMQTSRSSGMIRLDDSLLELVRAGAVRAEDALARAADAAELARRLGAGENDPAQARARLRPTG